MDKNPFDVAIEQFIREDSQLLLPTSFSPSGSESNSESRNQDQAVPIFMLDSASGNDVMEVSNEVVISSANSVLNSMLDMKPPDECHYKPIEVPLKKDEPEVGECTNNTIHMLLNFDKAKYTAIPVMNGVANRTIFTPTTTSLNPITIIGYNCFSLLPIITTTTTQPITFSSAIPGEINNDIQANSMTAATLQCDEKLPSSNESTRDNSDLADGKSTTGINHHGSYACTVCNNKFFTREYLQYHLMKDHGVNKAPPAHSSSNSNTKPTTSVASTSTDRLFRCSLCPKTYSYLRNLKKHEGTVHSTNQKNVQKINNEAETDESKPTKEHCRVCHAKFADRGALMIHMKAHTSTCQVCYKIFGSKRGLKLHSVIHYGNTGKQFGCTICDKRYSHSRSLKHHLKTHWNEVKTTAAPEASVAASVEEQIEDLQGSCDQLSPSVSISESIETVKEASPVNHDDDDPKADFDAFGFGTIESTLD